MSDYVDLLTAKPTTASKATATISSMDDARRAIISGLRGQKEIWMKDKGQSVPPEKPSKNYKGETQKSLWFKKKDDNNDYVLSIKCGNTKLSPYPPEWQERTDKKGKKSRVNLNRKNTWTVPQDQMEKTMDVVMEQVEKGEWDERIRWLMPNLTD